MKKIVVLGNSISGIKAMEDIRANDPSSSFLLFSLESELPYFRHLLADFVSQKKSLNDVYYKKSEYFSDNKVEVILDKKIARINLKKKRITTEDKKHINFDVIIISDLGGERIDDLKGSGKAGVFCINRLSDLNKLMKDLLTIDTVIVESQTIAGLKMAVSLLNKEKEVIFLQSGKQLLPGIIDEESAHIISGIFQEAGLRIIEDNVIEEILGDGDMKAVRLKTGKVFSSQAVILGNSRIDFRPIKDSGLQITDRIAADACFKTNIEDVYAIGNLSSDSGNNAYCDYDNFVEYLEDQGSVVAAVINGGDASVEDRVYRSSFEISDNKITFIGKMICSDAIQEYSNFNSDSKAYKKIFVENDRIMGAILINCDSIKEKVINLMKAKGAFSESKYEILGNEYRTGPAQAGTEPVVQENMDIESCECQDDSVLESEIIES